MSIRMVRPSTRNTCVTEEMNGLRSGKHVMIGLRVYLEYGNQHD